MMKREFIREKRVTPDSMETLELTVEKQVGKKGSGGLLRQIITIGVYVLVFGLFMKGGVQSMGVYVILMAAGVVTTLVMSFAHAFRRSERFPWFRLVSRRKAYREYLDGLAAEVKAFLIRYDRTLQGSYTPAAGLLQSVRSMSKMMYNRLPHHQDFLTINLGNAAAEYPVNIHYPQLTYAEKNRELSAFRERVDDILEGHRKQVLPCLYPLKEKKSLALVNQGMPAEDFLKVVNACAADIAAAHSPEEVVMCGVFGKDEPLLWMRMLPHVWHNGRRLLYCGTESEKEFANLVTEAIANGQKHVVAIVDADSASGCAFYAMFNDTALPEKLSVVFYSTTGLTPTRAAASVRCSREGSVIRGDMDGRMIMLGAISEAEAENIARILYNTELRDNTVRTAQGMPTRLTFFDMMGVQRASGLPRASKAQHAAIQNRFPVLVGQGRNGEDVYIDLTNDGDGNHCLVTGTNGSGKSEFVISYVTAACSMYQPDYLSFVVVDFKGAAMSSKINCLPHCRGEFTNEGGNPTQREIARITELLEAEITYRERIMKEADCANDLAKYHRLYAEGWVNIPLPRLLVVVDEVAVFFEKDEAAAKNITHIATVGRAVGLILMLSTQSKNGVIPAQVRTNINITVEFYSGDEGKKDREQIKGRAIINSHRKVNCECQMAYTAARDANASLVDFLRMSGSSRLAGGSERTSQFEMIRDEIISRYPVDQYDEILSDVVTEPLERWHESRMSLRWLQDLYYAASGASHDAFPVGISDNIYERNHKFFTYTPGKDNLLLYGKSRSGKTTFVKTLLTSLCSRKHGLRPNAAGIYIIARDPGEYWHYGFPQVGSILPENEMYCFLLFLRRKIEERRAATEKGQPITPIVAVIDGCYDTIRHHEELLRMLIDVTAESVRHGISVIMTMTNRTGIDFGGLRHFGSIMAFHMGDDFSYSSLEPMHVDAIRHIPDIAGRCLTDVASHSARTLETQIAFPCEVSELEIARQAEDYAAIWRGKPVPEAVPLMPEHVTLPVEAGSKAVPMGMARDLTVCTWEPEKRSSCLVSYFSEEEALSYVSYLTHALVRIGHPVLLVDNYCGSLAGLGCLGGVRVFDPDEMEDFRAAVETAAKTDSACKTAIVVWDYTKCMFPSNQENRPLVSMVYDLIRRGSIIGVFATHKDFQNAARGYGLTRLPQYLEGVSSGVLIGREPNSHTFGFGGLGAAEQGRPLDDGWGVNVSPKAQQNRLMKLAVEVAE